ncbi:MAG: acyl-CoA desaturase [Bryobacteraceae bacterium]
MEGLSSEVQSALQTLREEMKVSGMQSRPLRPVLIALAGHLLLGLGGLALFIFLDGPAWRVAALLASTFGFIGLGTLGHTASHGGVSPSSFWNRLIFHVCYPMLLQFSASYWRHSHVQVHHPAPNVVGVDDDCDLLPVFALNEEQLGSVNGLFRRWPVLQGMFLLAVLPFNGLNMMRQSWAFLLRALWSGSRREHWLDLGCLTVNVLAFLVIPMLFFSPATVLLLFSVRVMLIGVGLFAVLAPGHYPAQAACLSADQRSAGDYYLRQTATTVNFKTGPIGRFLCSGLEYQIEHHLFPSISHIHYPALAPLVRKFCRDAGLPYRDMSWGRAIWESWRVFVRPKAVVHAVESLRVPPVATEPVEAARR